MQYVDWVQGMDIAPPVYVDANILVGSIISNHPLYGKCVNLTGRLLADKAEIMLSVLSVDESIWAITKLAYCDIYGHPPGTNWSKRVYRNQRERIFRSHEGWINSVRDTIKDWANAGARIDVVPKNREAFEDIMDLIPVYMKDMKLTPADAVHLAVAQKHSRSFLTADSDFDEVRQNPPVGDLVVIKVTV